jgi:glucose-1-phosphate cytidylyltransferase
MVTVGDHPLLWHIMRYYASYGVRRFVLCLGYKADVIKQFALNYSYISQSFLVNTKTGIADVIGGDANDWEIVCVDTGLNAMTGARLHRVREFVSGSPFFLTYGDGLADLDLDALASFHAGHGRAVTVTAVHPPSRFGLLTLDGERVSEFAEKAPAVHDYINGGFFVCNDRIFDYIDDDDECVLERTPLERVAQNGELMAFRHEGFWHCMDTVRDRQMLEEAWHDGAPWKRW